MGNSNQSGSRNPSREKLLRQALGSVQTAYARVPKRLWPQAGVATCKAVIPEMAPLMEALLALEAAMPLVSEPEAYIDERLILERSSSGNTYIRVANRLGLREWVTTLGFGSGRSLLDWSACRMDSRDLGTPWDVARRDRRVVPYFGSGHAVIDGGANLIIDQITALGGRTTFSCEGHPNGAYISWDNGAAEIRKAFKTERWHMEDGLLRYVVRMPKVRDVHERDAKWRTLCARLASVKA